MITTDLIGHQEYLIHFQFNYSNLYYHFFLYFQDGEDDWSTSDPGLISILPNSSTTLKPNFGKIFNNYILLCNPNEFNKLLTDGGGPSSGTKSKTTNSTNNSATASTSNRGRRL